MSRTQIQEFTAVLRDNDCQVTKARLRVFKLLLFPEPQSMKQLLERAEGTVDRVSVYRSVELFEKLGIIHRIYIGWKYKVELTDIFMAHHHHLSCLQCGKIINIEDETHIDEFISSVAQRFNFQPRRHQFEVDGYCQDCSKTNNG